VFSLYLQPQIIYEPTAFQFVLGGEHRLLLRIECMFFLKRNIFQVSRNHSKINFIWYYWA